MIFTDKKLKYAGQRWQKGEFTIRYISKVKNIGDNYMGNKDTDYSKERQ